MTRFFKTIFLTCTPFAVTLFLAYLIGSFLNISWNPVDWTMDMRILMTEFGFAFGGALYVRLRWDMLL